MTHEQLAAADKAERVELAECARRAFVAAEYLVSLHKRGALGDFPAAKAAAEAYDVAATSNSFARQR